LGWEERAPVREAGNGTVRDRADGTRWDDVKQWQALAVLGTAQFLMVLDTSVMNVPIG
jgi:hypothetical protein